MTSLTRRAALRLGSGLGLGALVADATGIKPIADPGPAFKPGPEEATAGCDLSKSPVYKLFDQARDLANAQQRLRSPGQLDHDVASLKSVSSAMKARIQLARDMAHRTWLEELEHRAFQ